MFIVVLRVVLSVFNCFQCIDLCSICCLLAIVFFLDGGGGGEGFDILMAFPPTAPLSEGVLRGLLKQHSDLLNISEVFGRNCLAFS